MKPHKTSEEQRAKAKAWRDAHPLKMIEYYERYEAKMRRKTWAVRLKPGEKHSPKTFNSQTVIDMRSNGMLQREIAEHLGISQGFVSKILSKGKNS